MGPTIHRLCKICTHTEYKFCSKYRTFESNPSSPAFTSTAHPSHPSHSSHLHLVREGVELAGTLPPVPVSSSVAAAAATVGGIVAVFISVRFLQVGLVEARILEQLFAAHTARARREQTNKLRIRVYQHESVSSKYQSRVVVHGGNFGEKATSGRAVFADSCRRESPEKHRTGFEKKQTCWATSAASFKPSDQQLLCEYPSQSPCDRPSHQ